MKKHINRFGIIALAVMIAFLAVGCEESPLTLLDKEGDNPGTGPVDSPSKGSDLTGAAVDKTKFDSNQPPSVPSAPTGLNLWASGSYIYASWNAVTVPIGNIRYNVYICDESWNLLDGAYNTTSTSFNFNYGANVPFGIYNLEVYVESYNGNGSESNSNSSSATIGYYSFEGTTWEFVDDVSDPPNDYTLTISFTSSSDFEITGSIWDGSDEEDIDMNGTYTVYSGYAQLTITSVTDGTIFQVNDTFPIYPTSWYPDYFDIQGAQFNKQP